MASDADRERDGSRERDVLHQRWERQRRPDHLGRAHPGRALRNDGAGREKEPGQNSQRRQTPARFSTSAMFSGACLRVPASISRTTDTVAAEIGVGTPVSLPLATTWPFM